MVAKSSTQDAPKVEKDLPCEFASSNLAQEKSLCEDKASSKQVAQGARKFGKVKNAEFSAIYKGAKKWYCDGAAVFFSPNSADKMAVVASKKIGKAVQRNRAKRLLRAAFARLSPSLKCGKYILVARDNILQTPYTRLCSSLAWAFRKLQCLK